MGALLQRWARAARAARPRGGFRDLGPEERGAFRKLRREAREAGASLARAGRGGLSPSLVLGVMRRDGYRCKVHGDRGEGENGGLTVHHKGGVPASPWLRRKGHANEPGNLVTLCSRAHDEVHARGRAEEAEHGDDGV